MHLTYSHMYTNTEWSDSMAHYWGKRDVIGSPPQLHPQLGLPFWTTPVTLSPPLPNTHTLHSLHSLNPALCLVSNDACMLLSYPLWDIIFPCVIVDSFAQDTSFEIIWVFMYGLKSVSNLSPSLLKMQSLNVDPSPHPHLGSFTFTFFTLV